METINISEKKKKSNRTTMPKQMSCTSHLGIRRMQKELTLAKEQLLGYKLTPTKLQG